MSESQSNNSLNPRMMHFQRTKMHKARIVDPPPPPEVQPISSMDKISKRNALLSLVRARGCSSCSKTH